MLTQVLHLVIGLVTLFAPGLIVLYVLEVRSRLVLAGLAPPLTAGLVLVTSIATAAIGVPFNLLSFVVVVVVLTAVIFAVLRWLGPNGGRSRLPTAEATAGVRLSERDQRARLDGRALTSARVLGWFTGLGGIGLGLWTWKRGLSSWSTPTQEHDPITHSVITAYIKYTGNAAPWELRPLNVSTGEPVIFYPSGFPRLAALVSNAVGDPMTALNLVTVAVLAVAWPLSAAVLAAATVRLSGLGRGWTELAGGIAALVAASLYRPAISFAHDGGVLPNAAAVVMVPGLVATMLLVGRRQWLVMVALGVACAGVVSLHPSAAISTVLTLLAAWVGLLLTANGRSRLRASFLPLSAAGATALVFSLPILLEIGGVAGGVAAAPPTIESTPFGEAVKNTIALAYLGYLDPSGAMSQLVVGLLAAAGVLAVFIFRRGWPIATAYLFWVGVLLSFQLFPNSGIGTKVSGFYYNVFNRVQAHVNLLVPALIAGLVVFTAAALISIRSSRLGGKAAIVARPAVALGGVAVVTAALVSTSLLDYAETNVAALAERYKEPEFARYDSADVAAMEWLDEHVQPGEVILNNGNDGSTLAYVRYGLPILNVTSLGSETTPDAISLLENFNTYPSNAEIRSILVERNIRWVYVDSHAPLIGAVSSSWHGQSLYSLAPGLKDLAGLPGLEKAFTADHVTVYRLDLGVVRAL